MLVPLLMAVKSMSISLDEHSEEFIRQQVASGRYATASEVVCDALRLLEAEMRRETAVVNALREGEESGFEEGDLFGEVRSNPASSNTLADRFPWMTLLSESERASFVRELAQVIREWRNTATIRADPKLAQSLCEPIERVHGKQVKAPKGSEPATKFRGRRCRKCGEGTVQLVAKPGRRTTYKFLELEVPASLELPTCDHCGTEWHNDETAAAFDGAMEQVFRAALLAIAHRAPEKLEKASDEAVRQQQRQRLEAMDRLLKELGTDDITPEDIAAVVAEWSGE